MNKQSKIVICPKCGEVAGDFDSNQHCEICNTSYVSTDKMYDEWWDLLSNGRIQELREFEAKLYQKYVFCSNEFDQETFDRQKEEIEVEYRKTEERLKREQEAKNAPVRCPKCGSTQIQLVNRKWSLLTGIFTNKVDRVCIACKNKF